MIAPTSAGAKTNSGISGCPVERPSANASERPSILYLRESVRKGGAAGCGLVPVRPTAWQRAQFVVSNDSPRAASVVASSAKTGNIVIIVSKAPREYGTCLRMANRVHRLHRESCRAVHSRREASPQLGPRLFRLADAAIG